FIYYSFNPPLSTVIYSLSLHDALPIFRSLPTSTLRATQAAATTVDVSTSISLKTWLVTALSLCSGPNLLTCSHTRVHRQTLRYWLPSSTQVTRSWPFLWLTVDT